MPPLPVKEDLDVLRDLEPSLLMGLAATMMHEFILHVPFHAEHFLMRLWEDASRHTTA